MRLPQVAVVFLAGLAGGCAAAVPGYQPPTPKLERFQAATPHGGGFDSTGSYQLTDEEKALDCKRLNGSITVKILHLRSAGQRVKPSALAATAQSAAQPVVGGTTYGQDLDADARRDRLRMDALNRRLAEKNCPIFDIEAELAPGNTKPPKPIKAGKKA